MFVVARHYGFAVHNLNTVHIVHNPDARIFVHEQKNCNNDAETRDATIQNLLAAGFVHRWLIIYIALVPSQRFASSFFL